MQTSALPLGYAASFQGAICLLAAGPVVNNFLNLFRPVRLGGAAAVAEAHNCQNPARSSTRNFKKFKKAFQSA
ncbi:hypothetical protein [Desulfovibrio sp. DV]|uniref:hypothetical protein n=1 Tax=Desulfovibrio sp. DV TaxID=1844708 RepID=UPI001115477A|nr:hypothetical protein [Desulfovibrio sp. DV]